MIPVHIKAWEALERGWNESSWYFLVKGIIVQILKDKRVLDIAFPSEDPLRSESQLISGQLPEM